MGRKREKSELERYLDGMILSLRLQAAKRPEEWVRWGSVVALVVLSHYDQWPAAIAVMVVSTPVQMTLMKRRLGAKNASQVLARSMEDLAPTSFRRDLRKGRLDAKIGPEARALLESCAASANVLIATAVESHMTRGGGIVALKSFKPLTASMEALMKTALARTLQATMLKRVPDEETLAELREIDASLRTLRDEAQRLSLEVCPRPALPEEATNVLDGIKARAELDGRA